MEQPGQQPMIEHHQSDTEGQSAHRFAKIFLSILAIIAVVFIIVVVVRYVLNRQNSSDVPFDDTELTLPEYPPAPLLDVPVLTETSNDKDRDGISDEREAELGTSDTQFDTDGDGISDQTEITIWQTDPNNIDTDGDGFADGVEIFNGYNPNGEGTIQN